VAKKRAKVTVFTSKLAHSELSTEFSNRETLPKRNKFTKEYTKTKVGKKIRYFFQTLPFFKTTTNHNALQMHFITMHFKLRFKFINELSEALDWSLITGRGDGMNAIANTHPA
jgi:glycogen debranching enzyme